VGRYGHVCILTVPTFKPGDPPPDGYLAWHEWARVQHGAGLRQKLCPLCVKWNYPQEMSGQTVVSTLTDGRTGRKVKRSCRVCIECAAPTTSPSPGASA
jgi:hypothetical protein